MSHYAVIKKLVDEAVAAATAGAGDGDGGVDSKDVTQLKRENTGLRNKVRELEDRVTAIEKAISSPPVTARAQTAAVKGSTSGK